MIAVFPSRAVALDLWGFSIHWYGLLYLAAFVVAWVLLPRLQRLRGLALSSDEWSTLLSAGVLGVIVGGRLGFVLFYEPAYYLAHPLSILQVWNGGMSSHGGFLGVAVALLLALRRRPADDLLRLADVIAVPAALGLLLGRLGNFINLELYGTVTALPWGMAIPGIEGLRHPTQLYAMGKDAAIALLCLWHLRAVRARPGETFALFLVLYGVLRAFVEHFREQQYAGLHLGEWMLTRGQLLTLPIVAAGVLLWLWVRRRERAE